MEKRKTVRQNVVYALAMALVAAVYLTGQLDFVERRLSDARFHLDQRPANSDIVVLGIDPASLTELGVWPWPRRLHAEVLDRVIDAGAKSVVFNVDFSSRSNDREDTAFEAALGRAGARAVLPVFVQPIRAGNQVQLVQSAPLERFRRHTRLASANVYPSDDGKVRTSTLGESWNGGEIASMAAVLAGLDTTTQQRFNVDFGIRPSTVSVIPFVDVLQNRIDPRIFVGKTILIGPTAIELGSQLQVPAWNTLSGTLFHAVAAETLAQDRIISHLPSWAALAAALLVILGFAACGQRCRWQVKLGGIVGVCVLAFAASLYAHQSLCIAFDIAPVLLATLLACFADLSRQINEQHFKLVAQTFTLRRQDQILRQIVDNVFDALITVDEIGSIRSFNAAAERMFGCQADEAIGKSIVEFVSDSIGALTLGREDALEPFVVSRGTKELQGVRMGGDTFPMEIAVSVIDTPEKGATYIVLARDISDRKAAERSALTAQRRLAEAIESMSEPLAIFDSEDRLLISNSKFEELYHPANSVMVAGSKYEEILHDVAKLGLPGEMPGGANAWVQRRMELHRNPGEHFDEMMRDGRWHRIEEQRTSDGGTVQVITEVTDLKRRESELRSERDEAEMASRTKTQFIAGISHELRTPLNAIIGFSDIMKTEMMGPLGQTKYRQYADNIFDSALDLLGTINDILDVAKIEAGKVPLREEDLNLEEIVTRAVGMVRQQAEERQVNIIHAIDGDLPHLHADPRLVRQSVTNLLVNAVRYTHSGGRVVVTASKREDGGLTVSVEDTGIGIAKKDIERVMQPYERAPNDASPDLGVGLGLPLVRAFVELHGGEFVLHSEVGVGTKAVIEFPAERSHAPEMMTA